MRPTRCVLVLSLLGLAGTTPGQQKEPTKPDAPPKVVTEKVTSGRDTWARLTGKVKVVNAYTLRFDDGTEVDMRFAIDAPELEQQGLIGDKLYPCGKEAAEFLTKLIGENKVAVYTDSELVPGKPAQGPCFVGETHLQQEMVRHGWAVSGHSGMDAWEIIAKENKRGLWRGQFVHPKNWRKGERLPGEK